jgi:hypothetical protein
LASLQIFCAALQHQVLNVGTFGFSDWDDNAIQNFEKWIDDRHITWYIQTQLTVSNPNMTILTPKIEKFLHLRMLSLHNCRITELPQQLRRLSLLEEIRLGRNPLSLDNVESIFRDLRSLTRVHLMSSDTKLIELLRQKFPRIHLEIAF